LKRIPLHERKLPDYTRGEELFNMISHIVGGGFALCALALCIAFALIHGNQPYALLSGIVYGITMLVLYTMSSIYHGLQPHLTAKKVFQVIDHCSIFFLIAGTYTPITMCRIIPCNAALGWAILGVVWGVAILGAVLNAIDLERFKVFSMICYLGMGWCIVAAIEPMIAIFPPGALALLVAGGVAYTVGAVLYGLGRKKRYMHSVFHLFVLLGSILHFLCILLYVL